MTLVDLMFPGRIWGNYFKRPYCRNAKCVPRVKGGYAVVYTGRRTESTHYCGKRYLHLARQNYRSRISSHT